MDLPTALILLAAAALAAKVLADLTARHHAVERARLRAEADAARSVAAQGVAEPPGTNAPPAG